MILQQDMLGGDSLRLPIDGLPYSVQNIITTYAKALDCPAEFVLACAMQAVAQAAGDKFYYDNGVYQDYPQFYAMLLGSSTDHKSPTINKIFKPLTEADTISIAKRQEAIAGMSKEEKSKAPYTTHILQNATTEAYLTSLMYHSGGVTLIHDEASTFFDFNKYNRGNDGKIYCSLFANYRPYNIARKGEGIVSIPHPIVRVICGIQPEVLHRTFANSEMLDDGMLPRFLWYIVPDDFLLDETGVLYDTNQADADWYLIVNRLLTHQGVVRLEFDEEAQQLYTSFKIEHAKAKNAKSLYGYEAAVCGKLEIYAIIWAMTSRILRAAAEETTIGDTLAILGYDMHYSLRCMDYFRHTAMKVYEKITTDSIKISKKDWIRVGYQNGYYSKGQQSEMARLLGVSQEYVNQIVNGKK